MQIIQKKPFVVRTKDGACILQAQAFTNSHGGFFNYNNYYPP